jgi:proline iminopeptidase
VASGGLGRIIILKGESMKSGLHVLAWILAVTANAQAQTPAKPTNRAEAVAIIAEARAIVTPHGVERLEKVLIGGIEQWVSIRGNDVRNPVLIFFHGGPGYVAMPMSWYFGRGWEEYFTVVHWDQRASGKTHLLHDPAKITSTLSVDRALDDAEELIAWVRKEMKREKVFVLGHSGGSYLGMHMAQRRPEWLHAFVGTGQVANVMEGERRGWQWALEAAKRDGNKEAVRELEALTPYAAPGAVLRIEDLYAQRKWVQHYGGTMAYRKNNNADSGLARLSPEYSDEESRRVWEGNAFVTPILLPQMLARDPEITELKVPVVLFSGRHDINVNSEVAAEWLEQLEAPSKRVVWFEHSAHMPMTEEPGKFLLALVQYVRPFAEKAGDVPPNETNQP